MLVQPRDGVLSFSVPQWGMSPRTLLLPLVMLACAGCAGGKSGPASSSASFGNQIDPSVAAPAAENVQNPLTQIERADVVETVDAGLGKFLGNFSTEPAFDENEQFEGFRIVRIRNPELFRGLGLGRGDVVTRINEKPIESPPQAYEAFIALRTAPSLDIDYLRGGRPMRLSLPIVGEARPASSSAKTGSSAKTEQPGSQGSPSENAAESQQDARPVSIEAHGETPSGSAAKK